MFRDGSVRKPGDERPNADGEKAFGRLRCEWSFTPLEPEDNSGPFCTGKIEERDGEW